MPHVCHDCYLVTVQFALAPVRLLEIRDTGGQEGLSKCTYHDSLESEPSQASNQQSGAFDVSHITRTSWSLEIVINQWGLKLSLRATCPPLLHEFSW